MIGKSSTVALKRSLVPLGFTLMEVVTVMAIFTLASLLIASIFVNLQRAQQYVRDTQAAATEARYLLELVSREVRSGTVDYCGYGASCVAPTSADWLPLKATDQTPVWFQLAICGDVGCLQISRDSGLSWSTITSPWLDVSSLTFYLTPSTDPFPNQLITSCPTPPGGCQVTPDLQPQVTVVLATRSTNLKVAEQKASYLQTTITSRAYFR